MSEHSINHLGDIAKQILEVLRTFMKEVMGALNNLKKLPEMITSLRNDLNQGFHNLIQAQAEMEIYMRMAQLKSKKSLILAENEAISDFEKQLKEDFQEIDTRYSKINNELEEECVKRIEEIDSHLLGIPDKFPEDISSVFSAEILPLFENLIKDANISYSERLIAIKMAAEKTSTVIRRFIKTRNDFFDQVNKFEVPEQLDENKTYLVPIWLLEVVQDDNTITKAFLPADYKKRRNTGLDDLPIISNSEGFEALKFIEKSRDTQKNILKKFDWKVNKQFSNKITTDFDKYFDKINGTKYFGAKKAVINAVKKSNLQTIE